MNLRRWLIDLTEADQGVLPTPWTVTWPSFDSDLEVRVDHNRCARRGLGLRWDLIGKLSGSLSVEEAKAEIFRLREAARTGGKSKRKPERAGRRR